MSSQKITGWRNRAEQASSKALHGFALGQRRGVVLTQPPSFRVGSDAPAQVCAADVAAKRAITSSQMERIEAIRRVGVQRAPENLSKVGVA